MLRHQAGAAYTAALYTESSAPFPKVDVAAPEVEPKSLWSKLLQDVALALGLPGVVGRSTVCQALLLCRLG